MSQIKDIDYALGERVTLRLLSLRDGLVPLAQDVLGYDDSGYYFQNSRVRVPAKAIVGLFNKSGNLFLDLNMYSLSQNWIKEFQRRSL